MLNDVKFNMSQNWYIYGMVSMKGYLSLTGGLLWYVTQESFGNTDSG